MKFFKKRDPENQTIRHSAASRRSFSEPLQDAPVLDALSAHIDRYIGPFETVFHEIVSEFVHIDVLPVPATAERPWHALVTCGMSSIPMITPDGADDCRRCELMLVLPPTWPLDPESWKDERNYWPVRLLKELARLPHEYNTWLWKPHTVPHGDPAEPYADGTHLAGAVLLPPMGVVPDAVHSFTREDGETTYVHVVWPLYASEMDFKLRYGIEQLVDRLDEAGVNEIVNPTRPAVA